jgi:hypothetical protein
MPDAELWQEFASSSAPVFDIEYNWYGQKPWNNTVRSCWWQAQASAVGATQGLPLNVHVCAAGHAAVSVCVCVCDTVTPAVMEACRQTTTCTSTA